MTHWGNSFPGNETFPSTTAAEGGEIPEDIVAAARQVTRSWQGMDDLQERIARAILAERERCAKVADEHASQCTAKLNKKRSEHDLAVFESAASEAASIAEAIRMGAP